MLKFKFTCVFLFCAAFVRINGDDEEEYLSKGDFKAAMAKMELSIQNLKDITMSEMKLNFQQLKDITLGRCRKQDQELTCPFLQKGNCPDGFIYLPLAQSCYRVVYESHTWASADTRCQQLHKGARLAAITSQDENNAVKSYLRRHFAPNPASTVCVDPEVKGGKMVWLSGQRLDENICTDPFVWKLSKNEHLPFTFTDWSPGEPNCGWKTERCVHLATGWNYRWNDVTCNFSNCALCEYQPA